MNPRFYILGFSDFKVLVQILLYTLGYKMVLRALLFYSGRKRGKLTLKSDNTFWLVTQVHKLDFLPVTLQNQSVL